MSSKPTPYQQGKESFLNNEPCRPGIQGQKLLGEPPTVEWMEGWSKGWHAANIAAPVPMPSSLDPSEKCLNRCGLVPSFVPIPKAGAHVSSRSLGNGLLEITEDIPGFVAGIGEGITFGPFATEASATKHGSPKKVIFRRRRFVKDGEIANGSPSAFQLDENDFTTTIAG